MDVLGRADGVVSLDGPWLDDLDPVELGADFPYSLLSSLPEPGAMPGLQGPQQQQQAESRRDPGVPERGQRSAERREKGKLAQRKHRLKQKEREQDQAEQLRQVTEQLRHLAMERDRLKQQNQALESALSKPEQASGTAAAQQEDAAQASSSSSGPGFESSLGQDLPELRFFPDVIHPRGSKIELRTGPGQMYTLDDAIVKRLLLKDLIPIWEEIVKHLARLLAAARGEAESQAGVELQELVGSAIRLVACVSANNPRLKFAWLNMRLGSSKGASGGCQRPPSHTAIILASLQLGPNQRERILEHRGNYLGVLASLAQEQQEVEQQLQAVSLSKESFEAAIENSMGLYSLTERLSRLSQRSYQCFGGFANIVWTQVLTPFQAATFAVQAFPFAPDTLALAACLAEEAGLPTAEPTLPFQSPAGSFLTQLAT